MAMQICWTRPARQQIEAIYEYIAESNIAAADQQVSLLLVALRRLAEFPESGRPGRLRGTRELVVVGTPYIVAYRIRTSTIRVLAILHGAQRWPLHLQQ